ncbi:MAG TPA: UxaA family hydrolase, partial [Roseimicrobium sp.]|nr:UxaA family hydrolase [Roseimicrobium sp.]
MSQTFDFYLVARIPAEGDNVAIAVRRLDAGTVLTLDGRTFSLPFTILEGHRFACAAISKGTPLLSWGLPFGLALRDIAPGEYACNEKILKTLAARHLDFPLPGAPTFIDHRDRFILNEETFRPGVQVPLFANPGTFDGIFRSEWRGVGTRNYIVVVGASSLSGSYARTLAQRFKDISKQYPNIDGVVAVAHTEGGGIDRPKNFDTTVKTLAGFLLNPNVGAVLVVDRGFEMVNNRSLQSFLEREKYPIDEVPHQFLTLRGDLAANLNEGEQVVRGWLETVNGFARTRQPLRYLKLGLQCGGSDAFSGVSGNPLAGWLSRELVQNGGAANLAETDELIGAEPYVLSNVRDAATARAFLDTLDRFQEAASWHGATAEGNPSGGNLLRGLYNIIIKSIGAARKKDPALRLDYVIEYGTPMHRPGFYFMDSPGNDLESIAGQVAAGCNMILFTTGNGSITNFPFVPTIKVMTNSGRFQLLSN